MGEEMRISEMIERVTAPNPGFMTGNGTNSYIIRAENGDCLVIDPGPEHTGHIKELVKRAGGAGRIKGIVVSHMHPDHSPAAMPLAKATGAQIYSPFAVDDPYQDKTLKADYVVEHQQLLHIDNIRLRCIHTPGHVDNHMCYLLENEQVLFTGDHLMQGSTVVIIPPHGDMKKYIDSLQLLKQYEILQLAPGHGEIMAQPQQEIERIIQHRLAREAKVQQVLADFGPASIDTLVTDVYDDVDTFLHEMAKQSLYAHLLKLKQEGLVVQAGNQWRL